MTAVTRRQSSCMCGFMAVRATPQETSGFHLTSQIKVGSLSLLVVLRVNVGLIVATWLHRAPRILSCITDIKKKFNISPREVFIGGYSSGGDIGYPILFQNSTMFAGGLFINTSPRGDNSGINGINAGQNATFKGHIYHVAHTDDNTDGGNYSPATVRADMTILSNAGWTTTVLEKPGGHYDIPGASNNYTTPGRTDYDARTYLFPHINDGWMSPPGISSTLKNYDSNITNLNDGKIHTVCWTHSPAGVLKVYVDGRSKQQLGRRHLQY